MHVNPLPRTSVVEKMGINRIMQSEWGCRIWNG